LSIEKVRKILKLKAITSIVILIIISIFLLIEYYEFSRYTIDQEINQQVLNYLIDLQKNDEESIEFNDYLDDSIDSFYIIGPYLTSDAKHKIIGQKWYNYETFSDYLFGEILFSGEDFHEGYQQLVFIGENRIMSFARVKRNKGDFLSLQGNRYEVNEQFRSIEEYNQYYMIKKANE